MAALINNVLKAVSKQYQGVVAGRLSAYGLKYQDLLIEGGDVDIAIERTNAETIREREMRIKRAFDLSSKHKYLPYEIRDKDGVFDLYLKPELEQAKIEREERAIINSF